MVSFVMAINKSQCQSLKFVGVYLPSQLFPMDNYVALSRVTSKKGLKILLTDDEGQNTTETRNVVYKEVFRNIQ